MRRLFAAALLWAAALGLPAVAAQDTGPITRADVAYGPDPAEKGDLILPRAPATGMRPAVLVIHGGGWVGGARTTNSWFAGLFAARGFVVFNIDYRLGVMEKPETHWPTPLIDAQLAVRWLRAHAAELNIDPSRIGAVGDSAGGTLAVFLGSLGQPFQGDRSGLFPNVPCNVEAVIDQFGVMDLSVLGPNAASMVEGLLGSKTAPPKAQQDVSPLPFIARWSAPTLIVHGDKDDFVPIAQSHQLETTLQAHGVAVQFITFDGGHGFSGVNSDAIATLFNREIDWLAARLALH